MRAVFFDVETSGVDEKVHEITQIAAVAIDCWSEVDRFERKLKFDVARADVEALKVNHYDQDVWNEFAVKPRDAAVEFAEFCQHHAGLKLVGKRTGRPYMVARLAGHNVEFDSRHVMHLFKSLGLFLPADSYRSLCTMQRALWYFSENSSQKPPKDYRLETLCEHFGIKMTNAHDALNDILATVRLARVLSVKPSEQRDLFA